MPSRLIAEWAAANPRSRELHQRALGVLPGGIAHDLRHVSPFPVSISSASGAHKTDADGHDLVCYVMGHGSLLLGHNHPAVVDAIRAEAGRLLHAGSSHELEAEWAERIVRLVPSAERVHFTSSGTEATMLALQVARAHTGRERVVRFEGHFHGWHDGLAIGLDPGDGVPPGIPTVLRQVVTAVPAELGAVEGALRNRDVAAVILEGSGAGWGAAPLPFDFLSGLRRLTRDAGTLLVMDEIVTGFRWSPGGVQQLAGVTPDVTTLAKVMAGGMPGGAVAGPGPVMEVLEFRPEPSVKVRHPGTHNAHPVAAAAGIATLDLVADGSVQSGADEMAGWLRRELEEVFQKTGSPGFVYGASSTFRIVTGWGRPEGDPTTWTARLGVSRLRRPMDPELVEAIQAGMLLEGVHLFHDCTGLVSSAHTEADVEKTVAGFERTLRRLQAEGLVE